MKTRLLALTFLAPTFLALAPLSATTRAQNVAVEQAMKFKFAADPQAVWVAGEVQSTVIPPSTVSQCNEGRLLVSVDTRRPPDKGLVLSRRLDALGNEGGTVEATFDLPPNPGNYSYVSNDHDLVTLPNGDVFYLTAAASKAPLDVQKNPWFMLTVRNNFGPGAHSVVMAWRSKDCGQSFQFVSVYDPALSDDPDVRTCENPQFEATGAGKPVIAFYDMGGTDGQLVRVINGQMYLTYQCVGFERDPSKSQFVLDATRPLNKTLVAVADGQGVWKTLGVMKNARAWRMDVVQVPGNVNRFVFGLDEYLVEGYKNSSGQMVFPSTAKPVGPYTYGWDSTPANNPNIPTSQSLIKTNAMNNAITSRLPGSEQILVAFPDTFDKDRHGYRVLMYNPTTDKYADLSPILPKNTGTSNIIFHLTPIDNGQGPVLLYWYDVDLKAKTATIRGRFIAGEKSETEDIDIRDVGGSAQFDLTQRPDYWYGDYHTAGGYTSEPTQDPTTKATTRRFFYFPLWVEPDASVKFTRVEYSKETPERRRDYHKLTLNLIPERSFKPSPGPVERARLNFSREGLRRVRELNRRLEQPAIRRPQ